MLSCKETSLLLSESRERRLTWSERIGVRLHLWICAQCRRYERQLRWLRRMGRRLRREPGEILAPEERLSEAAKGRIHAAIVAQRANGAPDDPRQSGRS